MQTVAVNTPSHTYPIRIGTGLLNDFSVFQPYIGKKAAIISNETVAPLYLDTVSAMLSAGGVEHFAVVLPDGEQYKNLDALNQIYDGLLSHCADRQTTLIALGGGVIGDTAGFAAATYQRGVPLIQIPTTLLSQVDSSVGGKTAVNHPLGKNMIGAFYQPRLVVADLAVLDTLPEREFSAGMAEVVKYALLGDADFLVWLEQHMDALMRRDADLLAETVARCCRMKAEIVAQDETEQSIRAHLNLGHTFAHAIEAEMGYGNWLHGEAVAAGMVMAAVLSEQLGCLNADDTARIRAILTRAGLPVLPPQMDAQQWLQHMRRDKKVAAGQMRFISLARLGEARITAVDDIALLDKVFAEFTAAA